MNTEPLRDEMAVFADLGTPPPRVELEGRVLKVRMYRNGDEVSLDLHDFGNGEVVERCGRALRKHVSYVALLASERFGNLRQWASTQSTSLEKSLTDILPPSGITIEGVRASDNCAFDIARLDELLAPPPREASIRVMLIDGPAGIGKTKAIEMIAYARACDYTTHRRSLVLHVQSRGRILSFLQDLMAFSLQRLRLSVMFDQIPVLVRHGLVTLAIDGFDELGDPNGYDNAWIQIKNVNEQLRGRGTLILAGRETFIGLRTLKKRLEPRKSDIVDAFTLQPTSADKASRWLCKKWASDDVHSTRDLLDSESYALRPFFLAQLADRKVAQTLVKSRGTNLIPILVDVMLQREGGKFGDMVEAVLSNDERREYVHRFLCEVARCMADDETDIIDESELIWLVELALPKEVGPDALALLKNRAGVITFLANDDLPGYRKFAHSQLLNYFLSMAAIDALGNNEVPKFVRRNVLSADFLAVFVDVFQHVAHVDPGRCEQFFDRAIDLVRNYLSIDRGARNIGAWLLAALSTRADIAGDSAALEISHLEVDETIIKGTLRQSKLRHVTVNQLDIRAADLRELTFENCTVNTALVDGGTRVSASFPPPTRLRLQTGVNVYDDVWDRAAIDAWLDGQGRSKQVIEQAPDHGPRHGQMLWLLERACRSSSFWIPQDTDTRVDRFVKDPLWPEVRKLLDEHGFLKKKKIGASGTRSDFVHIRDAGRILANDTEEARQFHKALAKAAK